LNQGYDGGLGENLNVFKNVLNNSVLKSFECFDSFEIYFGMFLIVLNELENVFDHF
jgi:hypothetical protein